MKVGRNSKCPCKSGKKYKHCCLNKTSTNNSSDSEVSDDWPLEQYIGFNRPRPVDYTPFDIDEDAVCCLVSLLSNGSAKSLNQMQNTNKFESENVVVSSGDCANIQIEGPFLSLEEAFEYARVALGAIRFQTKPQLI